MRVAIAEFKSRFAKYIRQVQAGDAIEVTSHRRVVAKIQGVVQPDGTTVSRLITAGMATWHGGKPMGAALQLQLQSPPTSNALVSNLVLENRN